MTKGKGFPCFHKDQDVTMVEISWLMETLGAKPIQEYEWLNPFWVFPREVLPLGILHSHKKLLVHELDQAPQEVLAIKMLQHKIKYHMQHIVIISFVNSKIPTHHITNWVVFMNAYVKIGVINY
jgi:hypothetical protein